MQKKVELEINGKLVRVMPHVVEDMIRFFGATKTKRAIKEPPKELLLPIVKEVNAPKTIILSTDVIPAKAEPVEEIKVKNKGGRPKKNEGVKK